MSHEAAVRGVAVHGDEPSVPAVVLEVRDSLVPIFVSPDQARSIQLALDGEPFERPLTHDLIVDMVAEFGGAIDRIRVDDVRDGTFFAKIDGEQYRNGEPRELVFDARPSDAIALAIRFDCPIEVADEVIDRAGYPADQLDIYEVDEEDDLDW